MLSDFKSRYLTSHSHIAPLAVFRIAFGAIMLISIIRFVLNGWVAEFYINPKFHFTYYGFEWVKPLEGTGMYWVFLIMGLSTLLVLLGLFYRIAIVTFFLSFTYVELLDKTYYLNHYYFISIVSFLMILLPAHRYFSLDVLIKPSLKVTQVPSWMITLLKVQLSFVYIFAGIAKINYDWLFEAMPLVLWLPAKSHLPLIGPLLELEWIAYFFSWFGLIYDLAVGFLLFHPRTRAIAYFFVVVFHLFTAWFFQIGMFPFIMILLTPIFFSEEFHKKAISFIQNLFQRKESKMEDEIAFSFTPSTTKFAAYFLIIYFVIQVVLPFRYLLYPGKLFWTEEGYRFSWRVMLMEKGGTAFFFVTDPQTGRKSEVINSDFLTPHQEKMMATQPDMILQYAYYLEEEFIKKGIIDPIVTAESYVTLNGSGSRLFIDKNVDLTKEKESFMHKPWILSFKK